MSMFKDEDLRIERTTGKKKAGGANRNCVNSAIRLTHIPTGIQVRIDGRDSHQNLREARKELQRRLDEAEASERATAKKERRDDAIKPSGAIRTYKFKEGVVIDHRSGKRASLKDVLEKGRIDLLRPGT